MKYKILLESDRILFVKVNEKLVKDYLDMINDFDNVRKYISDEIKPSTVSEELEWLNKKLKDNSIIFSMIEKETNEFIGNIEIMNIRDSIGELGIAITKNKQDNHFGEESIKRIITYAFNELNLNSLELNAFNFNKRAIRCYEKCGFIADGVGTTKNDIHMYLNKEENIEKINIIF